MTYKIFFLGLCHSLHFNFWNIFPMFKVRKLRSFKFCPEGFNGRNLWAILKKIFQLSTFLLLSVHFVTLPKINILSFCLLNWMVTDWFNLVVIFQTWVNAKFLLIDDEVFSKSFNRTLTKFRWTVSKKAI